MSTTMTPEEQKKQAEEHKNAVQRATNASLENFHLEDPWRSRLLRFLAKVAGLPMPLNENDYNYQLKRANGDPIKIQTDFCSHPENFGNAVVLNTHSVPFDMYSLCKSGHIIFILSLVSLYIFLISTFFALLSKWAGCITFEGANWLAKGFLIVSGMGNGLDQSTKCMYIDCFAVMIGVYVSLPIFGAVVLVRLLDWTSNHIKASKKVLLSMRDGKPIIMVRCASSNGQVHYNLQVTASVTTFRKDTLSGEGYTLTRDCEFTRIDTMLGLPYNCVHVVEEGDHLLQDQVIIMNDKGRPEWNHAKIAMIQLQVSAEKEAGGRLDKRHIIISNTRLTLVDSDPVSGALPVWSNAVVNMPFAWRMSKGKKVATFDLAKLSDWEYNKTMLEKYAAEQEAKKLLLLSSAVASNMPEVLEVDSSEVIVNEDHTTAAASPLLGK